MAEREIVTEQTVALMAATIAAGFIMPGGFYHAQDLQPLARQSVRLARLIVVELGRPETEPAS